MSRIDPDDPGLPDPFTQLLGDKDLSRAARAHGRAAARAPRRVTEPAERRSERRARPTPGAARSGRSPGALLVGVVCLFLAAVGVYQIVLPGGLFHRSGSAVTSRLDAGRGVTGRSTEPGTCFDVADGETYSVTPRDCDDRHSYELVEIVDVPASQLGYPTAREWDALEGQLCSPADRAWTGYSSGYPDGVGEFSFIPQEDGWATGQRDISCLVRYTKPRTGTSHGLAQTLPGPTASVRPA